ncbi:tautomerase family protein [Sorangium sp. So ce1335]|uniref:tautomerase family protein n=1 Tax=Sorangium sp. So ce1335 TaxID=3133335 RepID=UPI003F5D9BAD
MPILNVKVSAKKSAQMSGQIASMLSELTARVLDKKPELTSIAIQYVDPEDWIVGGRSLAAQGKSSFYLDIKITDETNTKADKAQYIYEAFEGFRRLLGTLHEESYIHIHDVRAAAYGYGGKTQEYRWQHPD